MTNKFREAWEGGRQYPIFPASKFHAPDGLGSHPDYKAAKEGGDIDKARIVTRAMAGDSFMDGLKPFFDEQGITSATVIAPHRATSPNQLGPALADHISEYYQDKGYDFRTDHSIVQDPSRPIRGRDAIDALRNGVSFSGIIKPGENYLIADDMLGSGATLAAYRTQLMRGGANLIGGVTLASGSGERTHLELPEDFSEILTTKAATRLKCCPMDVSPIFEQAGIPAPETFTLQEGARFVGRKGQRSLEKAIEEVSGPRTFTVPAQIMGSNTLG